ncbi:MAG: hypothetical protein GTN98_15210 [Woeseiaceae bacterium]|nr:hypothetical protein [Woeseiaceae bacterium]
MRACLASLILLLPASLPASELKFNETVIGAGFRIEQPVLVASLSGDGRHVVLGGRTDDHRQRVAVFDIDNPDRALLSLEAGAHLIAYDVGRVGGADALFFIEPGRIMRYDFVTDEIVEFVEIRTIYGQQRAGMIIPIDFIRDINGDDLDDIVVPDTAGYRVRLQRLDGTLGNEVVLQGSSAMTVSDGRVSFSSRPLVSGEMTGDDLRDLAVWRGDELQIYAQLPDDRFDGEPRVIKLRLGLQTEAELQVRQDGFGAVNQDGLVETRIWSIEDLNGDDLPDVLTESLLNKGVFDKENDFRMHLGRLDGENIDFFETEDALLASSGLQYGIVTRDFDGDGRKDLLLRKVQMSFGRVIRALLSGNVSLQLHFYRMTDDDTFADKADYVAKTNVRFSVGSGQVDIPAIRVADFDADGLMDLMMQTDSDELSFQFGIREKQLFAKKAVKRDVQLPRNGELVTIEDLNEDGRADLVIRYNESDGDAPSKTIRVLITE